MLTTDSAPAHVVDRPALRRRLDEALARPLTLIVAPAGAGKSVLLAQWADHHPELPMVRIGIDPADDDPVRFSQRLLGGLSAVDPQFAELGPLVSIHGGGLGSPLLDALGIQMTELPEVVVVLDDLHRLSNPVLMSDLGRLVELLPPQVHLVLSSRVDLPISWSRHRLRSAVSEIRQSDLALDDAEAARLLVGITGVRLDPDAVTALVSRTEGWAAGLQLAGMTLRHHDDPDGFIAQFSGNDRMVADYLSEEVLQAQSARRRRFLLEVSVLNEMCADLVRRLTGEPDSQMILEELEHHSMFLVPLDTNRRWFRFHHLFRDMLRFRLRAEDHRAEVGLLVDAAAWHLDRGEVSPAVEYLLTAEAWDKALDVILERGSDVFERGEMATVIRWIGRVPEPVRHGRPDIKLLLAILMGMEGQATGAEDILRRVTADPLASLGHRLCAQAFLAAQVQWRTQPEVSIDMATRAFRLLEEIGDGPIPNIMNLTDAGSLETMTMASCGRAHFLAGSTDQGREWLERSMSTEGAAYSIWRIHALGSLGLVEAWRGSMVRAEALADEALGVARDAGVLSHPSSADAYLAMALVSLERGDPHRAALSLHEGRVRGEANRRNHLTWISHYLLAEMQAGDGQPDGATTTLLSTRNEAGAPPAPIVVDRLLGLRARLLRLGGSPEQALHAIGDNTAHSSSLTFESAAAALTLGRRDLADKILGRRTAPIDEGGPLAQVEGLLLEAWLADTEGLADRSSDYLAQALAVAEQHALVEVFIRAGPVVVRMVSRLTGAPLPFRDVVLERARRALAPSPAADLPEPLTDRELEILSYLPSRFTNTELAEHCYVSVNTIKTHMAHIYRKLDVPNRNGAINRAREIGLL